MGYRDVLRFVEAGHVAGFAPAWTEDGTPAVCFVVDAHPLPAFHQLVLRKATREQHVRIAVRVIAQLRRRFELD